MTFIFNYNYIMKKLTYEELLNERKTIEQAINADRFPINIIVDNVRSIYNVGSIFRTCDSALVNQIALCGLSPCPPREEISKTALDAEKSVPWKYFENTIDAVKEAQANGHTVLALELTDKARSYTTIQKSEFPLSIVVGNELTGISDDVLELCDGAIEIPMFGVKHSLNVSVSTGIVLFEALRTYLNIFTPNS